MNSQNFQVLKAGPDSQKFKTVAMWILKPPKSWQSGFSKLSYLDSLAGLLRASNPHILDSQECRYFDSLDS